MDSESFEQMELPKDKMNGLEGFLMENMEVEALYLDDEFLNIQLPTSVKSRRAARRLGMKRGSSRSAFS